ncbi:MAG: hypothetical protein NT116_04805 [Candidatus Parcubacteria bacterium]|nr:hypothetical protein [Candidatus Parcubacteria bacterium]
MNFQKTWGAQHPNYTRPNYYHQPTKLEKIAIYFLGAVAFLIALHDLAIHIVFNY